MQVVFWYYYMNKSFFQNKNKKLSPSEYENNYNSL